ncbi:hypothetical protein HYX00_02580 [Candidatus Woesearchaeota archaeon]|nr:hypothetical protein [Candidatus Woesearchaeota archaeon]
MKEVKMKSKQTIEKNKLGHWIFIFGLAFAFIAGLVPKEWIVPVTTSLIILGTLVGFLNIKKEETTPFLIATTSLIVIGTARFGLTLIPPKEFGLFLATAVGNITIFVLPAALIITIKAIWALAED